MLNPKLLSEAFPINKVEVFFDAEDHSDFLGFQWEKVSQGRIPIGLDTSDDDFNTIGKTGGEKEHALNINEIPPLQLRVSWNYDNSSGTMTGIHGGQRFGGSNFQNTELAGGGQAHNNMPPYIVMAFWKRVA